MVLLAASPGGATANLFSLAVGYFVPRIARLPKRQAIAIGMEIGIHNGTLAIAIASGPLPCSTIPPWPSPRPSTR